MKPILTRFLTGIFFLLAAQAFGQTLTTNFVIDPQPGQPPFPFGSKVVVEMRVTGFTNMVSMQFPILYNKDVLKFDSLTAAPFSNWSAANFTSLPAQGRINVSWQVDFGNDPDGVTLPSNARVFRLCFTAQNTNGSTTVNISNSIPQVPIEFARQNGGPLPPNQINFSGGGASVPVGNGQPTYQGFKIIANTIYIPPGERGCMPVTVNEFMNIISMQFAMHWDPTVLQYECTRRYNLPGWSTANFAVSQHQNATLLVTWDDPSGTGVSRNNNDRIFDVCFKAIGAPGATSQITIDGSGFDPSAGGAEAIKAITSSQSVNVWTTGGVNGPSGIAAPAHIVAVPPPGSAVAVSADIVNIPPSTTGCVPIKVNNFTNETFLEFAVSYNTAHLSYTNVQFGANPLNLQASNITHVQAQGVIKLLWTASPGVTVPDGTTIFSACFNTIGPAGTETPIGFTSTACPQVTGIGVANLLGGVPIGLTAGAVRIMQAGPPSNATHVSCNGGNNGAVTIDVSSGPAPTGYAWTGPNGFTATTQNISGLSAGTYTVTVTYSGGNTATASATVNQPAAITQTHTVSNVTCFGGNNGAITLNPSGGTSPYTFQWSGPNNYSSAAQSPNNLASGTHTVTIKDANNCNFGPLSISVGSVPEITLPSGNIMVTTPTCFGLSNGAITINPIGGAGGFTYQWNNGASTKDLSNIPAGTYTPVVTDASGCVKVLPSITVDGPPQLVAVIVNKSDVRCFGTATGGANINFTGGTGNKTFCWFTPPSGPCVSQMEDPNNLPAGTYNLIVTDQNGCTSTHVQNVVIGGPSSALTVTGTTTPSPCFDTPNGAIDLTVTGGWSANYSYAWTGNLPSVQDHPSAVQPGTYTVTVTDANQCTATHSLTVAGSTAIVADPQVQNVTCFGQNNGGINLNLSGGNPTYSVVWSNTPLTGSSIGNLNPGSYQPTVTDAQGCTKVFNAITVTGPSELMVSTNITQANPNDGAIALTILSGGTPSFTFAWSGPNGFSATTQSISGLSVGDYTVVITDANQCVRQFSFNVPSGNVVGGTTIASIADACAEDGCIFLSIPAVASAQLPITLNWGFGTMQTNSLNPQICDLKAGIYNITVTAANGNSTVLTSVQVAQRDPASVNVNTNEPFSSLLNNGKITLSPASGVQCQLQYQWAAPLNSTAAEVTGLGQGTYTVTITNPCSGCTQVRSFNLTYSPPGCAINNSTSPNCAVSSNGSIDITVQGGFLPYSYSWVGPNNYTASQEDISGLAPGTYTFVVTDQNGKSCTLSQTLTTQSNLAITNVNELSNYGGFQVSGANECDGVAMVAFVPGVGATNILWSNGGTGVSNNSLCAGAYSVTVTDAAGCSSVWSDALTAPAAIAATAQSDGVKCHSDCNGIARVLPSGGVGPYSVRWSTGQNDPLVFAGSFSQAVGLCGGNYTVTITDDNGVDQVFTVNVPRPAPIEATFSPTAPRNFNACDGEMTINITGAVAPVTYTWSGSFGHAGNSAKAEGLCSGEFIQFVVVDANGCSAYLADTVPYPADGCFRVSPVITPGTQDGKNDYVYITCIETALKSRMEIYNRWGQLVFETENYTNQDNDREHNWNGLTRSGSPLADGVYYYVLSITYVNDLGITREETRKGAINLLR